MQYDLIMCRSLTYAQRAQRVLERLGIAASVMKAPQAVSGSGCSYGVRLPRRKREQALEALKRNGIAYGKVFAWDEAGKLTEVPL